MSFWNPGKQVHPSPCPASCVLCGSCSPHCITWFWCGQQWQVHCLGPVRSTQLKQSWWEHWHGEAGWPALLFPCSLAFPPAPLVTTSIEQCLATSPLMSFPAGDHAWQSPFCHQPLEGACDTAFPLFLCSLPVYPSAPIFLMRYPADPGVKPEGNG